MKLKTKLIPFAAVATICGAVTPLTACSSYKMTNIYGMSAPTFGQYAPGEFVTEDDATNAYIHFMEANPNYFIEDMKWGIYQNWMSFYENSNYAYNVNQWHEKFNSRINSLNCAVSTPTFGKVSINTGDTIEEYPTMSFSMKVDVDVEVETVYGTSQTFTTTHRIKASGEAKYEDMLFFAYPATRNDKTHGTNYILPSEMKVDTTGAGWFITISEDAVQQYKYRHNFSGWNISYNFKFDDEITKYDSAQDRKTVSTKSAKYDSFVDTYTKLENLISLKTYSYADPTVDAKGPNDAWLKWMNQDPESLLANTVLLDCVTHYLDKCKSQCYMFAPEHLTIDFVEGGNVDLDGAFFYPTSDFTYDKRNEQEITLEVYNANEVHVDSATIDESYLTWSSGIKPSLKFTSGTVLQPDWDQWLINKGAANTIIPAQLNLNGQTRPVVEEGQNPTLGFILGSDYSLWINVHPKGSVRVDGKYEDGQEFEIRMDDGNGTILANWLEIEK